MTPGRLQLHEEIRALERSALGGLELVADAVSRTVQVVVGRDEGLAHAVIADDDLIDGRFLQNHQEILSLIARQAPVATDLRVLAALLDVIRHIERMGDQCVNICKVLIVAPPSPANDHGLTERLREMGDAARDLALQAGRAFRTRDVPGAERLADLDDRIDQLNRDVFESAVTLGGDPAAREWAMRMTQVARAFERIGDYAVDIGEEGAFVSSGVYREFTDASHPQ
jgi:phosphate transport system protein